jgi:hypothetical protein
MRAYTDMIVRAGDPDSTLSFIAAEHEHQTKVEDAILRELQGQLQAKEVSQHELDAIEAFLEIVRERRSRFDTKIAARRAQIVRK